MRHFGLQDDALYPGAVPMSSLKRQLLQIILPLAILALAINWLIDVTRGGMLPFDTVAYPALITLYMGCAIVLFLRPRYVPVLEVCSFGAFMVYMAAYVTLVWYSWRPSDDLYRFATLPQWIPLIYVAAFLLFEPRQALRLALAFFAMLLVPGGLCLLGRGATSIQSDDMHVLLDTYFSNAIYIALLAGGALLKDRYIKAAALAEVLASVAHIDDLTGAFNRRHLDQALRQAIEQAQRYERSIAVILLDVDSFKRINDTFGHAAGDQVLAGTASAIQQQLRTTDTFGRWGGEEFLVVAPETDREQAALLAERLRAVVAQQIYPQVGNVTASFGVATCRWEDTAESLVGRADAALYRAKLNGRNRIETEVTG
jgi:diguanylate cyclase (GGDEF)-like protein